MALLLALATAPALAGGQVLNPAVTQATIGQTICSPGWTKTVRPPTSYTQRVKRQKLAEAKAAGLVKRGALMRDFELDHRTPLVLGGHPSATENLALQPWDGPDGAFAKDQVERRMRDLVCGGKVSLLTAQVCMVTDWHRCPGRNRERGPAPRVRTL